MKHPFHKFAIIIPVIFLLLLGGIPSSRAEVPNPDSVTAVAVYEANINTDDDWPEHLVNYNITDPDTISALFLGVEADTVRDCSMLETDNDAYVYVKFNDMSRKVYHLLNFWSHFSLAGSRENCHYVNPETRSIYIRHAQVE